jgi:hypothetical protein
MMDPGAIFQDLREADLTRNIAPRIIPYIEKAGVEVKGVPLDLPMLDRIKWINDTGYTEAAGDICLEVHINDGGKRGYEAWFKAEGGNASHKLATVVVDTLVEDTGYPSQGVKSEFEHELRSLTFLNRTNPASVLLEVLFLDNPEDIAILKDNDKLENIAKSIARGILKYMGKDMEGKELPADKKPDLDAIKPKQITKPAAPSFPGMDDFNFDDDFDLPMPSLPSRSAAPATMPVSNPMSSMPTPPSLGGGFGGFGAPTPPRAGGNNFMMDREQRKEMIKTTYVKMLGREPTQSDLNYFLNNGISEQDLVKKIVDSQEHLDLVKAKQELADVKKQKDELEIEVTKLKATVTDSKSMLDSLNNLLVHKNRAISELEQSVYSKHGVPSSVAIQRQATSSGGKDDTPKVKMERTPLQRFFAFLSKRMS